eukprot:g3959.t1
MLRVLSVALLACLVAAAMADAPAEVENTLNAATDDAVKMAKKATKAAINSVKGGAGKVSADVSLDEAEEEAIKADIVPAAVTSGTASTGGTGATGSTGATGATGAARLWYFAPSCNGRGHLHRESQKCQCQRRHGGQACQYKRLNTGPYSHHLGRTEKHGRYVGQSMCLNGTPLGEDDCVCNPGWAGYHCDKRECKNGRWTCGKSGKYCKVPTVCECKPGFQGRFCSISISSRTGSTGATGATGAATGSAATGPKAEESVVSRPVKPKVPKESAERILDKPMKV